MNIRLASLLVLALAAPTWSAPQIVAFTNGTLIGSNLTAGTTAAVEWAPTAAGPWTNTWQYLAAIPVGSNGVINVTVPFFYRLQDNVGGSVTTTTTTSTSTSAEIVITTTTTSSTITTAPPPSGNIVAFVGFNADGNDDFAVVALTALPASTTIYITDNEWNGSPIGSGGAFNTGEGIAIWDSGISVISAGTVVAFTNMSTAGRGVSSGTLGGNTISISGNEEGIFAFEGTSTTNPTAILAAIANNGETINTFGSLAGTGLATNSTAVSIAGGIDTAQYVGPRTGSIGAAYLPLMANVGANWQTENTGANDGTNGIPPDLPFNLTPFTP